MIRAVIDTNILIRAIIKPQGTVGPVLQGLRNADYQLVYSDPLLAELADVLARPRLAKKYGITTDDVATVLSLILLRGEPVLSARRIDACRDPKDNMVLEAAVAGQVDFIASGDKDLLTLSPFERIPVLSPAAFPRRLTSERRRCCLTHNLAGVGTISWPRVRDPPQGISAPNPRPTAHWNHNLAESAESEA